jgi:hypothetical protein
MAFADYSPQEAWKANDSSRAKPREVPEEQADFAVAGRPWMPQCR